MRCSFLLCIALLAAPAGAVEFQVNCEVDAVDAAPGDGICADASGACTLRAAVMETNALPGPDAVSLPAGVYQLAIAGNDDYPDTSIGDLDVTDGLTISGAGADVTIIDAAGIEFADGVVEVWYSTVELGGLTIRGAYFRGVWTIRSDTRLVGVTITGNDVGVEQEAGRLRVERSLITGNGEVGVASYGAAVGRPPNECEEAATLFLANTTVNDNVYLGAGPCVDRTSIVGSTLTEGLFVDSRTPTTIRNSILVREDPPSYPTCFVFLPSVLMSGGHNLGDDGTCGLTDPTDLPNTNPMLGPLQHNGGPTETHALLPGSPAIDAIPPADCRWDDDGDPGTPEVPLATDQRGVARPQGAGCDIGAVEVTACANGLDDDGDGLVDYPADPGCKDAYSKTERPQCQDAIDNDGDGKLDFDGGASANHGVALGPPDPQCTQPWRNTETPSCGLGVELAALLPAIGFLRRRRRARSLRMRS